MITFDDIKFANESIRTTKIKEKDYAEVNQRVKAFRMVYPTGSIETYRDYLEGELGNRIVGFTTNVYFINDNGERVLLASGNAEEKESSTFINKTSFIENCETSSVGRALGFCGLGIDTSVASAEEVTNAINNQEQKPSLITKEHWKSLNNLYSKEQIKAMYEELGITNGKDIPDEYAVKKIDDGLSNIKNELPDKEFF